MEPLVALVLWLLFSIAITIAVAGLDWWLCQRWRKCQKRCSASRLTARFMVIILLMVAFAISISWCVTLAAAIFTLI